MDAMGLIGMLFTKMKKIQKNSLFAMSIFLIIFSIFPVKAINLPTVGGDTDAWGDILNDYLQQEHNTTGNHNISNMSVSGLAIKSGRWTDVRTYGAKGDGATDDTAAIQAAINSVTNNGGGVVFFPEGDYLVSSSLIIYSKVTLQGNEPGSTRITAANTLNGAVIKSDISSSFFSEAAIRNLQINASNQISGDGIWLSNIGELTTIDRVKVLNACSNGISIESNSSSIVLGNLLVTGNGRCGTGAGIYINNSHSSNYYIEHISGEDNEDALLKVKDFNSSTLFLVGFDAKRTNATRYNHIIWLENGSNGNLIIGSGTINQSNASHLGDAVLYNSAGGGSIGAFNILGGIWYDTGSVNYTWYYASDDTTSSNKSFIDLNGRAFSQAAPYIDKYPYYTPYGYGTLELSGALNMLSFIRIIGIGSDLRFSNASFNDTWDMLTGGTNYESINLRYIKGGLNQVWLYLFDSAYAPTQRDEILFGAGGNYSLAIMRPGVVGIGKPTATVPGSTLEVNGTVTLNTTTEAVLVLGRNTTAIACTSKGGIIYSGNRHYGCNGTGWNAFY